VPVASLFNSVRLQLDLDAQNSGMVRPEVPRSQKRFFPSRVQALEITIQTSNTQQIDRDEEAIAFLLRPFTLGDVRLNANEVE